MNLPILAAVGPPGCGKTTLLRRLARQLVARGETCAAVLLEPDPFDAWALEREGIPVEVPRPGERLTGVLARAASRGTVVFVECADGAAFELDTPTYVVALLEAREPLDAGLPSLPDASSVVLVNKMDTWRGSSEAALLEAVQSHVRAARVIATVESAITWEEILECAPCLPRFGPPKPRGRQWIPLTEPLPRYAAELLVHAPPPETRRVKGCIRIAPESAPWIVQVTGRSGSLRPVVPGETPPEGLLWTRGAPGTPDAQEILRRLGVRRPSNSP